ncbi:phosphotransferase [Bacillus litorisediminis]|uniref:phosphotransferase n=1 Tax=Bacillus litorisediminis TaxID=2922713 RepID=UPI001FACE7E1|nr:phosphotransferase [Bacillus litorisediminis]
MKQEVPSKWIPYISYFSMLEEAVKWEPLRQWNLSDVWRVTLKSGKTVVAKLGNESMAGELKIYKSILEPLDLPCPRLYESYENSTSNVFLMEDLGRTTVEMKPTAKHFTNAARTLAEIRNTARSRLGSLESLVYSEYYKRQEQVLYDLNFIIESHVLYSDDELDLLRSWLEKLPKHLVRLYGGSSVTITHNEYNAKNLMIVNESIVPIDWSNAYLSPHLGDLYCLICEAEGSGIEKSVVIGAYSELDNIDDIEWQIQVGGICWLIRGLCWVCQEGIHKVPVTRSWIPKMITSIYECFEQL